jgi:hypothetical protein
MNAQQAELVRLYSAHDSGRHLPIRLAVATVICGGLVANPANHNLEERDIAERALIQADALLRMEVESR